MPQMRIPRPASHFGSAHAMAVIFQFCYRRFLDWFGEGRPAAAALEFVGRGKQRFSRHNIHIDAFFELIPKFARKSSLCAAFLRNVILLFGQLLAESPLQPAVCNRRINAKLRKKLHFFLPEYGSSRSDSFVSNPDDMLPRDSSFLEARSLQKIFAALALDFRDAFYRFFYLVIGVIDSGLILAAAIITLDGLSP